MGTFGTDVGAGSSVRAGATGHCPPSVPWANRSSRSRRASRWPPWTAIPTPRLRPDASTSPAAASTPGYGSGCCARCWTKSACIPAPEAATRDMLQLIWRATGLPERGGLRSWVPYENMDTSMQENIMRAAAAALHLAATGQITPRGIHGPALRRPTPARLRRWTSRPGQVARTARHARRCGRAGPDRPGRRPAAVGPARHRLPHPSPLRAVPRRPPRSRSPRNTSRPPPNSASTT
jgi:hypothetical protein